MLRLMDKMNLSQIHDLLIRIGEEEAKAVIEDAGYNGDVETVNIIIDHYDGGVMMEMVETALMGAILGRETVVVDELLTEDVSIYMGADLVDFAESRDRWDMADYIYHVTLPREEEL